MFDDVHVIRLKVGFDECRVVDYKGVGKERAGGLILMWKEKLQINILSFSLNYIAESVVDEEDG